MARKSNFQKNIFYDSDSAIKYLEHLVDAANTTFLGDVTEQLYKNSNEFTYRDTGDMYKSGELFSQFNKGIIVERTPYVRRRYYEGGKPGAGNKKAEPHWFEKTFDKYKKEYENQYAKAVNQAKKG